MTFNSCENRDFSVATSMTLAFKQEAYHFQAGRKSAGYRMAVRSQVLHARIFDRLRSPAEVHGLRRKRIGPCGMQQSIKDLNINKLESFPP